MVLMPREHIEVNSSEQLQQIKLSDLMVTATANLEIYLKRHYPGLQRHMPKEKQLNHRPEYLSCNTNIKTE